MKTSLKFLPLLFLTGCIATVPRTVITFDPRTQAVSIQSPKDIELKGLKVELVSGAANVTIETYSSHNNTEVVKAVAEANQKALADFTEKASKLLESAISVTK